MKNVAGYSERRTVLMTDWIGVKEVARVVLDPIVVRELRGRGMGVKPAKTPPIV
jgi:hypothetical protein